jgi:hypothetical protein
MAGDEGLQVGVEHYLTDQSSASGHPSLSAAGGGGANRENTFLAPESRTIETLVQADDREDVQGQVDPSQEPMSNPLALLAYASDAAQASETSPTSINASVGLGYTRRGPGCEKRETEGHRLLHRPGYVSLGLQLDRASLVQGLDTLLDTIDAGHQGLDYFKRTNLGQRDVGPDLDPVELGLVTMEDAHYLFPM